MTWEIVDKNPQDSTHYSIARQSTGVDAMAALREMFPDAQADEMNFVLFSTSGVHGTYATIEEVESGAPELEDVTYLIVHPRLVGLRYGNVTPKTADDFAFLKRLRESSKAVVQRIG